VDDWQCVGDLAVNFTCLFGVVRTVAHLYSMLCDAKTGCTVQKQEQRGMECAWCLSLDSTMSEVERAHYGSEEKEYISA
jgi:hypothetical protein